MNRSMFSFFGLATGAAMLLACGSTSDPTNETAEMRTAMQSDVVEGCDGSPDACGVGDGTERRRRRQWRTKRTRVS